MIGGTRRSVLGLGLASVLGLVSGCSDGLMANPDDRLVDAKPGVSQIAPDQRRVAPIVGGDDLDGKPLSTADYPGVVLVLNVWGSWCAPCRKEAPDLVKAAQRTAGVAQFIGINTRDLDPANARAFVRSFEVPYPSIFDPAGTELLKFEELLPAAIPSTLILDRQGRTAARIIGVISEISLVQLITDVAEGR